MRTPPTLGQSVDAFRNASRNLDYVLDRGRIGSHGVYDALRTASNEFGQGTEGAIAATVRQQKESGRSALTTDNMYALLRDYGNIKVVEGMALLKKEGWGTRDLAFEWVDRLATARNDAFNAAKALSGFNAPAISA